MLGFFLLLVLLGVPIPYISIGKKIKKGYKWKTGIVNFLRIKLFVDDNIVEVFNWHIEEFENFIKSNSTLSFFGIFQEVQLDLELSETEKKYFSDKFMDIEKAFNTIEETKNLNRKGIFKETVTKFVRLVRETSKNVKEQVELIQKKQIKLHTDVLKNYDFTASEYNDYLRHVRVFLDRNSCYHNAEIDYYKLMLTFFVPEEIL